MIKLIGFLVSLSLSLSIVGCSKKRPSPKPTKKKDPASEQQKPDGRQTGERLPNGGNQPGNGGPSVGNNGNNNNSGNNSNLPNPELIDSPTLEALWDGRKNVDLTNSLIIKS